MMFSVNNIVACPVIFIISSKQYLDYGFLCIRGIKFMQKYKYQS